MKKSLLLSSALTVALVSVPAVAGEFYAMSTWNGSTPAPLQDAELSATEGGASCSTPVLGSVTGGVPLCAWIVSGISGGEAHFAVGNALSVTVGDFLQVVR
ncbi:MAG: hypothetical protein V3V31_00120 [Methylococcales bacterium]